MGGEAWEGRRNFESRSTRDGESNESNNGDVSRKDGGACEGGSLDGHVEMRLGIPWQVAALALLVRERPCHPTRCLSQLLRIPLFIPTPSR